MHAADSADLLAIRKKYLPHEKSPPEWFWIYQAQYSQARSESQ